MPGIKLTDLGPLSALQPTTLFYVVNDVNASFKIDAASLGRSLRSVDTLSLKTPIDQGVSAWTTTNTYSAAWQSTYTVVNTNSANWILDGGNTKSAALSVGTKDSYNLNFITNNTRQAIITNTGALSVTNKAYSSSTANSDPGGTLVTKDYLDYTLDLPAVSSYYIIWTNPTNNANGYVPNLLSPQWSLTGVWNTVPEYTNDFSFTVPPKGNRPVRLTTINVRLQMRIRQVAATTYWGLSSLTNGLSASSSSPNISLTPNLLDIGVSEAFNTNSTSWHPQLTWSGLLSCGKTYSVRLVYNPYVNTFTGGRWQDETNDKGIILNGVQSSPQTYDYRLPSLSANSFSKMLVTFL